MSMGNERAALFALGSIGIGLAVLMLKFGAWWLTGSVALYSDALESTINVVAAFVAFLALQMSAKPADARHPYGHQKIEYIAAVFEGALIITAAIAVFHAAYNAYIAPKPVVLDPLGIGLNFGASLLNGIWCAILFAAGKRLRSPVLRADAEHLKSDVVSSIGALGALLVVHLTGLPWLDPVIGCAIALNILYSGWQLMQASFSGLMDEAATPDMLEKIRAIISAHAVGAIEAHDLRTRSSGRLTFIEFHLVVPAEMRVDDAHDICDKVEAALKEAVEDASITIHVEPASKAEHHGIVVL
jgi:cation diffusion facilitator family transporter